MKDTFKRKLSDLTVAYLKYCLSVCASVEMKTAHVQHTRDR